MPRKPIDYSKSCVYRLIYNNETRYVGSTTNFTTRKGQHKTRGNSNNEKSKHYNYKIYSFIRETGGWGANKKWDMVLVETYTNCKTAEELRKYERQHYELLLPDLNTIKPYITEDDKIQYKREYYENNKEYISEYNKQYRTDNKDVISGNARQYYEDKKDVINENQKQYYVINKVKIREQAKEKHNCVCGGKFTTPHKMEHNKSKKHIKYCELIKRETS